MSKAADKAHLTPLHKGYAKALACVLPVSETETVPLFDAADRVLARDLICLRPLPPFNNSSMDGYGVRVSDAGKTLPIDQTFLAGDDASGYTLPEGSACKIMTGAMVPAGVEAVVPFEDAQANANRVTLPERIKPGQHIRPAGEEVDAGEMLLKAGEMLTPAALALLASQGCGEVAVLRRIKAAVLATGSEIVEPWQTAKNHQIHNSNATAIAAILKTLGAEVAYLGALPDRPEALREAVAGFAKYDLIVTSGGVSTGEADFTDRILQEAGLTVAVQSMALKPGKNLMIGRIQNTVAISLPGNPQAAMTLMTLIGGSIAAKLQGRKRFHPATALARVAKSVRFKPDRANVVLGTLQSGEFAAVDDYRYGTGMLTPLAKADVFAVAPEGKDELKKGEIIRVVLPLNFCADEDFYAL